MLSIIGENFPTFEPTSIQQQLDVVNVVNVEKCWKHVESVFQQFKLIQSFIEHCSNFSFVLAKMLDRV